ncbi:MAG: SIS domain-containing protein [Planctomycetaceae bacterium]|nr:MAG: SIS domain-containing protein [Planctomycetaceae bacterium]
MDKSIITAIERRFSESAAVLRLTAERLSGPLAKAAEMIVAAYRAGGGVFIFGNGGSAADAQHIACELVGRFLKERPALRAESLCTDASVITAVANDYDFSRVFARQLEGKAVAGDVAIALSTSGNSANVEAGLAVARKIGMKTIVFTGQGGGRCAALADILLDVPCAGPSCRIQEAHTIMYHILCELVENAIAG